MEWERGADVLVGQAQALFPEAGTLRRRHAEPQRQVKDAEGARGLHEQEGAHLK